jgi:hypothetical protein
VKRQDPQAAPQALDPTGLAGAIRRSANRLFPHHPH